MKEMANKPLRWGVIGLGRIAEKFTQDLSKTSGSILGGVASRDADRAAAFAAQHQLANCFGSYQALIDSDAIDAVYIATPHCFHFTWVKQCLLAGKPVLCEKPLTVNTVECKQLIELAWQRQVFLMEALWTRYLPIYDQVMQWLASDEIGSIEGIQADIGFECDKDPQGRHFNNQLAGGALLDLGVYPIAVSQYLLGQDPISFGANATIGDTDVDEMIEVELNYPGGVVSKFFATFLTETNNELLIIGSKGRIRIHSLFFAADTATLYNDDGESTVSKPLRAGGFEYEIDEAARCIEAGYLESPAMKHADSLANMELMDSIRAEINLKYRFED